MRSAVLLALVLLTPQEEIEETFTFQGTPAEAMASIEKLSDLEEAGRAIKLAEEFAGDEERPEPLRAEFHYAIGVVRARHALALPAQDAFNTARALAGPGELRLDATYNVGTLWLEHAEAQWQAFQESGGQPPPGQEPGEDPLGVIRGAYLLAKDGLIERLRGDWRDEDTRANLELVQRRLRMLDAIEEMQQEQEQPEDQQQEEQGQEEQPQDEHQEPPEEQEGEGEQQLEEQPNPEESEEGTGEGEQQTGELPEVEAPPPGEPDAERRMSREEVMQLLDKLQELEEERELLEALLRQRQRVRVERDW